MKMCEQILKIRAPQYDSNSLIVKKQEHKKLRSAYSFAAIKKFSATWEHRQLNRQINLFVHKNIYRQYPYKSQLLYKLHT